MSLFVADEKNKFTERYKTYLPYNNSIMTKKQQKSKGRKKRDHSKTTPYNALGL